MPKFEKSSPELVARFAAAIKRNAAPESSDGQPAEGLVIAAGSIAASNSAALK